MLKKLSSPWVSSVAGLLIFLAVTAVTWNAAVRKIQAAHEAEGPDPAALEASPAPAFANNVEVDALVKELREEREMLNKREKDLSELAARIRSEREELTQLTNTVHRMQKEFDLSVTRVAEEEPANLKRLAKTYASMEPEGAAGIFKQMDDGSIVKIMVFMKDQETGPVLAALSKLSEADAKRAADLTEKLRLVVQPKKK